jgi:adenylate kinase
VPVIEKYSQLHGVVKVNGMGSFAEVFERTSSVLESLFKAG